MPKEKWGRLQPCYPVKGPSSTYLNVIIGHTWSVISETEPEDSPSHLSPTSGCTNISCQCCRSQLLIYFVFLTELALFVFFCSFLLLIRLKLKALGPPLSLYVMCKFPYIALLLFVCLSISCCFYLLHVSIVRIFNILSLHTLPTEFEFSPPFKMPNWARTGWQSIREPVNISGLCRELINSESHLFSPPHI